MPSQPDFTPKPSDTYTSPDFDQSMAKGDSPCEPGIDDTDRVDRAVARLSAIGETSIHGDLYTHKMRFDKIAEGESMKTDPIWPNGSNDKITYRIPKDLT
jgi:hypothetical protein